MTDAQALGYCTRGVRRWFEGRSVTFAAFLAAGVPVDWLRAQGDAMAERLADYVEQQAAACAVDGAFEG